MKQGILSLMVLLSCIISSCTRPAQPLIVKFEGEFATRSWPLREVNRELPYDWSSAKFLTFEFHSTTTQRFTIRLHDAQGNRKLSILPFQGVWVRVSIPMKHFQKMNTVGMDQASIWKTPRKGCWIGFTGETGSVTNIDSLSVSMGKPINSPTLQLRNFRLTDSAEDTLFTGTPLVDEFGQWIPDEWEGKANNIEDLKRDWTAEEESMKIVNNDISKYGGFRNARSKATGFFHVEQIDGRWWFIDPEGYLFYSSGSCCIQPESDLSRVKGREYLFKSLPPDVYLTDNERENNKKAVASFYTWNLKRRFGDDWYNKWIDMTSRRMESWGINTVGNWSDPDLGASHRKAYVATLYGWGIETGKMGMPDVYSSGYAAMVDSAAHKQCAILRNDPWLLGYFIGNEPAWPGRETELVESILTGENTAMKQALEKYLVSGDSPEKRKAFVIETFSKFLSTVCSAIKKYDPNHLNLGLRFGNPPADELIRLCKEHFNVFSINHYGYSVSHEVIQNIYDITSLPVIIGEFHFGIPRRGLAPGLVQTKNPEERAAAYMYYVENTAAHPAIIGTHWFQWIDQPSTGRFDGENYNIGIVDVTDRPYPEMVEAVKETFSRLPDIHSGKIAPVSRKALVR
jgi:hypothetical protein